MIYQCLVKKAKRAIFTLSSVVAKVYVTIGTRQQDARRQISGILKFLFIVF